MSNSSGGSSGGRGLGPGCLYDDRSRSSYRVFRGGEHDDRNSFADDRKSFASFSDLEPPPDLNLEAASTGGGSYRGARLPENEEERVDLLRALRVLDSLEEESFDNITRTLSQVFDVPIALVSLVDSARQWFKSAVGLECAEMSRDVSFCAHMLLPDTPEVLLVPDAAEDPAFCNNPLVRDEPLIRFYCGAPIIVNGLRMGSVCILDRIPRSDISRNAVFMLANFADIVAGLLRKKQAPLLQNDLIDYPNFLVDDEMRIVYSNQFGRACIDNAALETASLTDFVTFDNPGVDPKRNALLVHTGVYNGQRPCLCFFHPASEQIKGGDMSSNITCPYEIPVHGGKEYSFVTIKFEGEAPSPARPEPSFMLPGAGPNVFPIRSADEMAGVTQLGPCAVLLTSRCSSTCEKFTVHYRMTCKMMPDRACRSTR
jgi:hypothetical protein